MRLIDADALIQRTYEAEGNCEHVNSFAHFVMEGIRNEVQNQSTVVVDRVWILSSERLPEENQNVIACFAHGTVTELAFYDGKFHGVYSYDEKVIIAWQPLPEPYKA